MNRSRNLNVKILCFVRLYADTGFNPTFTSWLWPTGAVHSAGRAPLPA